jgi:hypothetical protein
MDDLSTHKLRRAWFSGYRVADVEILVAQMSLRLSQLAGDLGMTRARLEEAERERRELAVLLDSAHRREVELIERASAAEAERDEAVREALSRATHTIDEAQLDAARIRADATLDAERARGQVDELLRLRDSLAATLRAVTRDFERVMRGEPALAPTPARVPAVATPGPPPPAPAPPAILFPRSVEIEAGPFADFASLSAFEQSLNRLPKVEGVYIRRFEGDRATIEVSLEEPAPLLADMTERLPYHLSVDHAGDDRIALHISAPHEPA